MTCLKWLTSVENGQAHVTPIGDLREHEFTMTCWCHPEVDDEFCIPILTHNSADGREKFETGERKMS